jgi:hypothetical protein
MLDSQTSFLMQVPLQQRLDEFVPALQYYMNEKKSFAHKSSRTKEST